jgi:type III secretion protein Q
LQWAGASFDVRLPANACQIWMAASYPTLDLPDLPDSFAAAVLESAMLALMSAPKTLQRGAARIETLQRQSGSARSLAQNFGVCLRQGTEVVYGSLSTDALGLMLMAGLVSDLPVRHNKTEQDTLPMMLRVEIGTSVLSTDEVFELTSGDTVMIEHCWLSQDGGVWLGWDQIGFRASLNDNQLVVTHTMNSRGLLMPIENSTGTDQVVSMNSIPVRLTFDIGERMLSLGELKALQVGQSFDLTRPINSAVLLRVNGALVGVGELVEIDGNIGVTITSLSGAERGST